jgi:hypothetical protein
MTHDGSDCKDSKDGHIGFGKPTCHNAADSGADFYIAGREGLGQSRSSVDWMSETWTFPTKDLEQIYRKMNITSGISELEILSCSMTMFGGSILEKYFAEKMTEYYTKDKSFLTDQLDLWYHGGLEDMATHVGWKWARVAYYMSEYRKSKE